MQLMISSKQTEKLKHIPFPLRTWPSFLLNHKLKYSLKNYGYGPHKKKRKEERKSNQVSENVIT